MKKVISLLVAMMLCFALAVTAFATDGFVNSPGESGEPCDHADLVLVGKKDPTCTEDGHTGYWMCSCCGEIIDEGSVIKATGHCFNSDGICEICGAKDVPKTGDNSNMVLWIVLMVASAAALVTVASVRRKKA